jgi:hypothetical protein
MLRSTRSVLTVSAALAAAACASTSFNSTWRNPAATPGNFQGQKVAALVMSPDQAVRFGAEDALARELTARGAVGIPAYSLIPKELTKDKEKAKEFLEKAEVAGVVVMRVVGKDQQVTQTAGGMYWGGPAYATFWGGGYYGYGWGAVYSPGYITTDTIVSVETLVYSLKQDKLVWAGQSETTNPSKVGPFISELVAKVAAEMKKEGLVAR